MTTENTPPQKEISELGKQINALTKRLESLNIAIKGQQDKGWINDRAGNYLSERERLGLRIQTRELEKNKDNLTEEERHKLASLTARLESSSSPTLASVESGMNKGLESLFTGLLDGKHSERIWVTLRDTILAEVKSMIAKELAQAVTQGLLSPFTRKPDAAAKRDLLQGDIKFPPPQKPSDSSANAAAKGAGETAEMPDIPQQAAGILDGGLFGVLDSLLLGIPGRLKEFIGLLSGSMNSLFEGLMGGIGSLFGGGKGGGSTLGTVFSSIVGWFSGGVGASSGGHIKGPGTPTSDSIRAWLSDGEYVTRAAVVGQAGALPFLHDFNRRGMRALDDWATRVRHASGGLAGIPAPAGSAPRLGAASLTESKAWANQQPVIKQRLLPILDPDLMADAMRGPQGEQMLELHITRNPAKFRQLMGVNN